MDSTKAFSVDNGIIVDESDGGPFYTGGTASPVGLGLPVETIYVQTVVGGVLIWKKVGAGDTASDWREYNGSDLPFDPTGYRLRATDVEGILKELREKQAYVPDSVVTTLNGTKTLTNTSLYQQNATGSATGYSYVLPDATTMFTSERFEIINGSSEPIDIKDDGGTVLFTLIPSSIAVIYLASNFSADGLWQAAIANGAASGIQSYVVASDTDFTTMSDTDDDITSFSVVPVPGRYFVIYTADIQISLNNKLAECVIHGETVIENTRRSVQGIGNNFKSTQTTTGEVTMLGTNSVHVKVNVSGGSLTVGQRSLVLIRLGE